MENEEYMNRKSRKPRVEVSILMIARGKYRSKSNADKEVDIILTSIARIDRIQLLRLF
jgi:hypothetical protein